MSQIRPIGQIVFAAILLAALLPALRLDKAIAAKPQNAPLPREDRFQFYEDWTSGVGGQEIVEEIQKIQRSVLAEQGQTSIDSPLKTTVYTEELNSYYAYLYFDKELRRLGVNVEIADWLVDPLGELPATFQSANKLILFVRNRHPDIPPDWPVEKVWSFNKTDTREVAIYRVIKKD